MKTRGGLAAIFQRCFSFLKGTILGVIIYFRQQSSSRKRINQVAEDNRGPGKISRVVSVMGLYPGIPCQSSPDENN